ncbi:Peptidase cysteine/serine, trypsin-like protein [Metarhizium guizhouense ARSEF 977]|uniref:Peptidase cysteine/serine, trypsin-like protein n=1 Tax=Metarhizium guizhouense (strain ARSEF 977) TaxID=1276136 RepID=A0A0B4GYH0_METGA|nr:Peptidase cysteine/serine, trypsin-like protein [Metarhizium guizhouense ARSEF 977]
MVRLIKITLVAAFSIIVSAATIHKRIKGGEYAKGGEFPFIVSIRQGGSHVCGGSLLDSTTVLTAAHCARCLGSVKAGTLDSRQGGVEVQVASAALYPRYSSIRRHDDIGILKLATPIEESDMIRYATLPASGSDPVLKTTAVVAGCKVNITIHERGACSEKLKLAAVEDIICAGDDGKDACEGDSGGPLVDPVTGDVIGLVTWGTCRDPPTAYTRVSSYIDFINGFLGGSDSSPLFNVKHECRDPGELVGNITDPSHDGIPSTPTGEKQEQGPTAFDAEIAKIIKLAKQCGFREKEKVTPELQKCIARLYQEGVTRP